MPERHTQAIALLSMVNSSLWRPLLLLPGLLCSASTVAETALTDHYTDYSQQQDSSLALQRKIYQQAEQAYNKKQFAQFKRLTDSLSDYPLQPYLEYKALTRRPSALTRQQISDFLQANEGTVIGDRFRLKLIKHAIFKHDWQSIIDLYRTRYGVSIECHYLDALINTQQTELAYPRLESLWLSASSQPKSCDKPFNQWQAAGKKTPEIVWQRFKLAISKSNRQLAQFLIRSMPPRDAEIATLWLKVHKKPELVTSSDVLNLQHPEQGAILLHGLKRLSRKDIHEAINTYNVLKNYPFSSQQSVEIYRYFGLKLARQHQAGAGIWLARVPDKQADKQVREWRIRTSIRQGDWSLVLKNISLLPLDEQANYRWQYWWAHANDQLGNHNDAQGIYHYLAGKRSYYGFLAADRLNLEYAFQDKPVEPSAATLTSISQQPEALRAREFYYLDQIIPARREWQRLINRIDTEQKLAASKLAQLWNWHDRAIITMGRTRYRDDIELRFPMQHENNVNTWSNKHNIEAAWTYAIIRRESAFMSDARSPVGAMGLMQLMPSTARMVARQLKIRYQGRNSLLTTNINIRLGTGYLERMLEKLDSQQVLATAAYNAGPHRVEKWLPEHQKMEAIRWIETIPFTETREYVSNVLAYMVIYEHRMDREITRLSLRMPPVPARNPQPVISTGTPAQTAQALEIAKKNPS